MAQTPAASGILSQGPSGLLRPERILNGQKLARSCANWAKSLRSDPIFARAFLISLPPAILAAVVETVTNYNLDGGLFDSYGVLVNGEVYGVVTTLLGFLIVFRNSQAYGRFWEACTVTYSMQAQLFDAASSLIAFCSPKEEKRREVAAFRHTLIRLLSILNSLMMAELQHATHGEDTQLSLPVLDPGGLAPERMKFLEHQGCKVEIISQWIQQLALTQLRKGVVDVPAPIATRAFQEIGAGILEYHKALMIAEVPFPMTYVTTMMVLLGVHMALTPICMVALVEASGWAFLLTFISIFTLWALALLGLELDSPFKPSVNRNIDLQGMHMEYNERLVSLIVAAQHQAPVVVKGARGIDGLREQCRHDEMRPSISTVSSKRSLSKPMGQGVSLGPMVLEAENPHHHAGTSTNGTNSQQLSEVGRHLVDDAGTLPTSEVPSSRGTEEPLSARQAAGSVGGTSPNPERWRLNGDAASEAPQPNQHSPSLEKNRVTPRGLDHPRSGTRASRAPNFKDDPRDSAFADARSASRATARSSRGNSHSSPPGNSMKSVSTVASSRTQDVGTPSGMPSHPPAENRDLMMILDGSEVPYSLDEETVASPPDIIGAESPEDIITEV
mmetsp:Transcript_11264/g.25845  ORF Transcript_11264/g.25845 Transcript_11264/m.25845 type:complete len:615 (-) Transcript_11264:91-1935(-)|eukprot:CAMPEP_0178440996 /NCGR_PEP_ID=MMETSP0689_2-20121128/37195_1 /TAXON_ID=160604 /ORGANISM="Amphidinium massartii, Strain CS-259" /LENGTH=614 /DNA_ID=CAMNT_0020064045 /DNA_START=72 /DNA_END=1916 /DNA_ORIENTATION=-